MLTTRIDSIMRERRIKNRTKTLNRINFKLNNNDLTYEKRNNFIELQIEDCLRFLGSDCSQLEKQHYRTILKIQKNMLKKQIQKDLEMKKE